MAVLVYPRKAVDKREPDVYATANRVASRNG